MANFKTIEGMDFRGKRVLLRVDLNVPMESGKVTDVTRIERVAPTITELADKGGKVHTVSVVSGFDKRGNIVTGGPLDKFETEAGVGLGDRGKLIGKEMLDAQDVDGKFFVKERVEMARAQPTFWQDYKFANPVSKKVEPKQMYCERVGETAVCAGVYKL